MLALEISPAAGAGDAASQAADFNLIAGDFAAIGADFHTWIADLGADFFSAVGLPDLFLP